MVVDYIRMLEAGLREHARQAAADRREGEELVRQADGVEKWVAGQERILEQLKAALGITDDATDGDGAWQAGGEAGGVAGESPVYERGSTIRQTLGDNWEYLLPEYFSPDKDEETREPIYDVGVVSGLRNSRERALAAARVYGPNLRERALAKAIFLTGETRAADAASVRGSLGGLVKYGAEWRRERGSLIYEGKDLKPDWETIRRLSAARKERQQMVQQEEDCSQNES